MKNFALLIVCLLAVACSKKEVGDTSSLLGLDYYPLTQGKFVVYQVDSIVFTEIPKDTTTYTYQLKEVLADEFEESNGSTAKRLERFARYKNNDGSFTAWHLVDVWLIRASNKAIEVQESNVRFTRLSFPVERNASWNGNAPNTKASQDFSYEYVNQNEGIGGTTITGVAKVNEVNNVNLIEAQQSIKKYAKGIGLVYSEYNEIKGNTIVPGKNVFERIESGLLYKQVLITHGIE